MEKPRKLTETEKAAQQAGGTYLLPGVWIDQREGLHFSLPELLAVMHVADTPVNRAELTDLIQEFLRTQYPDATIIEQE